MQYYSFPAIKTTFSASIIATFSPKCLIFQLVHWFIAIYCRKTFTFSMSNCWNCLRLNNNIVNSLLSKLSFPAYFRRFAKCQLFVTNTRSVRWGTRCHQLQQYPRSCKEFDQLFAFSWNSPNIYRCTISSPDPPWELFEAKTICLQVIQ